MCRVVTDGMEENEGKVKDLGNAVGGEGDKGILFYEMIRESPLVNEYLVKT